LQFAIIRLLLETLAFLSSMGLFQRSKHAENANTPEGNGAADPRIGPDPDKEAGAYDDSPVKFLTVRSIMMGILVSMGGFIFGYDTGTRRWVSLERQLAESRRRSDLGISGDARLSPALCRTSSIE